jgi:hypothetical protein
MVRTSYRRHASPPVTASLSDLITWVLAVFVSAWPREGHEGTDTMTNNMHNGAPHERHERDRDRDSERRSEAIGAGRTSNAASINSGRDPVPSELFRAHPLEDSLRDWLNHAHGAADVFSDEEILALSEDWATELVERVVVESLVLLETEAYIEHHRSTRASVLVVPFTGDPDFFELDPRPLRSRSGPGYTPGPFGRVTEDALHLELTNTPELSPDDHVVETRQSSRM